MCTRSHNLSLLDYVCLTRSFSFFFFFQAEDGIRDLTVTGVQTCALPILPRGGHSVAGRVQHLGEGVCAAERGEIVGVQRSEERRVGKECRSRWSPYH